MWKSFYNYYALLTVNIASLEDGASLDQKLEWKLYPFLHLQAKIHSSNKNNLGNSSKLPKAIHVNTRNIEITPWHMFKGGSYY